MDVKRDNIAVGFLGAGKMAQALAKGFISAGELVYKCLDGR